MYKLNAAQRVLAEGEWFKAMSPEHQKLYIKEHPESKYAQGQGLPGVSNKPAQPTKPAPVKPAAKPETIKLNNRKKKHKSAKDMISDAANWLLGRKPKKAKKKAPPISLTTNPKQSKDKISKKDGQDIKYVSTKGYSNSGKSGVSPYGFWKDADTWVSMTKNEYKSLSDEEIEKIQKNRKSYGL